MNIWQQFHFLVLSLVGQTSGPSDYLITFFPGTLILGIGMGFTVAPLTTTLMVSAGDQFSGIASGINNALLRISGVLTNGVLGALAVVFFFGVLESQLINLPIVPAQKQTVMAQAVNLGNARVPSCISLKVSGKVSKVYQKSFITVYRKMMLISAFLCFLGIVCTFFLIKKNVQSQEIN
ncbi:drug resistance transporter, EmrB/QacA subfamily [Arcticibacter svalbardensis MN12-7]|uniref:Drug resistance transporter, EmrB/QacA subfamily n=1 Tax=Arcticibacter svalbardensis MN12-7 TaxID=1150600 RepID=R9GVT6_9SPHI|nr:drug resistance transporter EmrB/QacA subfamily [Arcticibacter svalbardensis]EOR95625.1 drug resistance transporter, EmrB/QacA subfamily [Arcticibacter svalbardensis MN12-7]